MNGWRVLLSLTLLRHHDTRAISQSISKTDANRNKSPSVIRQKCESIQIKSQETAIQRLCVGSDASCKCQEFDVEPLTTPYRSDLLRSWRP
jgi:hypothetical protein